MNNLSIEARTRLGEALQELYLRHLLTDAEMKRIVSRIIKKYGDGRQ